MTELDPYVTAYANAFRHDIDPFMEDAISDELAKRGISPSESVTVLKATDIALRAANAALSHFLTFVGRGELDLVTGKNNGNEVIRFRVDPEASRGIVAGGEWDWILRHGSVATATTLEIEGIQE